MVGTCAACMIFSIVPARTTVGEKRLRSLSFCDQSKPSIPFLDGGDPVEIVVCPDGVSLSKIPSIALLNWVPAARSASTCGRCVSPK